MHGSARTRVQCDSWHLLLPPIAKGEPSVPTAGPSVVSFVMECECRVQSSARAPNITAGVVRGERDDDARCVAHWSRRLRVFRLPAIGSASWGCSGFGVFAGGGAAKCDVQNGTCDTDNHTDGRDVEPLRGGGAAVYLLRS